MLLAWAAFPFGVDRSLRSRHRISGRIEAILAYAIARDWRTDSNPATWRGNLEMLLPGPRKLRLVEHHAALDWRDAPYA